MSHLDDLIEDMVFTFVSPKTNEYCFEEYNADGEFVRRFIVPGDTPDEENARVSNVRARTAAHAQLLIINKHAPAKGHTLRMIYADRRGTDRISYVIDGEEVRPYCGPFSLKPDIIV